MSEQPKRLKKNISFSEHERDIYEYLDGIKNASALIKRLVYNHMILEKGMVSPVIPTDTVQKTDKKPKQKTPVKTKQKKNEEPEEELSEEDLENQALVMELDI